MANNRKATLATRIADQTKWISEHGGGLSGYVARYGSRNDPDHYGDGGEAIYAADKAELDRLVAQNKRTGPARRDARGERAMRFEQVPVGDRFVQGDVEYVKTDEDFAVSIYPRSAPIAFAPDEEVQ